MKTKLYTPDMVTEQMHATFEREGWAIFNGNEVQRIDITEEWCEGFTPPQLKSDKEAIALANKHGFIIKKGIITDVIVSNDVIDGAWIIKKINGSTSVVIHNELVEFPDYLFAMDTRKKKLMKFKTEGEAHGFLDILLKKGGFDKKEFVIEYAQYFNIQIIEGRN